MRKLAFMAIALLLGVFVFGCSQQAALANPASSIATQAQSETAQSSSAIQVYGHGGWRGGGGWRGRGWGWRGRGWGWGGGPYWGWGPGYWGPYCSWRCGPWGCRRVCW